MKTFVLSCSIVIVFLFTASAQITFEKTYGGSGFEDAHSVKSTLDGGYIIAGATGSFGSGLNDGMLIKIDSFGNQQWLKTYGGAEDEDIHFLALTSDSGFIISGTSNSWGANDNNVYIVKTNQNGDTLWTKILGGTMDDAGYCVQQAPDGNYVVAGKTKSFGNGGFDIYFLKLDSGGNVILQKTFGSIQDDYARFIELTSDNGYIIAGTTLNTDSSDEEIILLKINANGDSLWSKTFDFDSLTFGYAVEQTTDGGFIITGYSYHYEWDDIYSLLAIKTDSVGNQQWSYNNPYLYFYSSKSNAHSIRQTNDGGYIVAGANNVEIICKTTPDSGYYPSNLLLLKLNANGIADWFREYYSGNGYNELGTYAEQTPDGGYIVSGYKGYDYLTDGDVYIIKTDSTGNIYTAIDEKTVSKQKILVYPNPNNGKFNVPISKVANEQIEIYNAVGEKVFSKQLSFINEPLTTSFPAGIYFLKIGNAVSKFSIID